MATATKIGNVYDAMHLSKVGAPVWACICQLWSGAWGSIQGNPNYSQFVRGYQRNPMTNRKTCPCMRLSIHEPNIMSFVGNHLVSFQFRSPCCFKNLQSYFFGTMSIHPSVSYPLSRIEKSFCALQMLTKTKTHIYLTL